MNYTKQSKDHSEKIRSKIIAVDFDGTLCVHAWPDIGAPNTELIERLDYLRKNEGVRLILWTNRVGDKLDEAVAWCKERGLEFDAVNENLPESIEFFGGDTRKIFADEYIDDRNTLFPSLPFTGEPTWAEREVRLACEKEASGNDSMGDAMYGISCYNSALRAYQTLCKDGHSGFSIGITKGILNRLIDGKCLTPIEEEDDLWIEMPFMEKDGSHKYQCGRMSALFKTIAPDGTVTYSDVHRVRCINIESPDVPYHNNIATRLVDKLYPITMPYFPTTQKFTVYTEEFLVDPKNGDYDTVAYLYLTTPTGEKMDITHYFKEENGGLITISKEEYEERKARRVK